MMDEKTQPQQPTPEASQESPVAYAESVLKRMEAENKRAEENLKKQELLLSRAMISGKSLAGDSGNKKEETPAEYKARIMKGIK